MRVPDPVSRAPECRTWCPVSRVPHRGSYCPSFRCTVPRPRLRDAGPGSRVPSLLDLVAYMQGCPFATRNQVSTQEPRTPVCVCVCACVRVCVTLCVWGTNFDFKAYRTKETNLIRKPRSCCENPRISNYSDLSFADRLFLLFGRNHIWVLCKADLSHTPTPSKKWRDYFKTDGGGARPP